jgi:hypothetical protein
MRKKIIKPQGNLLNMELRKKGLVLILGSYLSLLLQKADNLILGIIL